MKYNVFSLAQDLLGKGIKDEGGEAYMSKIQLSWHVGNSEKIDHIPSKFIPATVPGAVQLDWAKSQGWEEPYYSNNISDYSWMEDSYWTYKTEFARPAYSTGENVIFYCGGVDYAFQIKLNGKVIHNQEGMFSPIELDISGTLKIRNILEVIVFPVPKSHVTPVDNFQANQSCKPAVSYGWDFHPRLIPLGIWKETFLEIRPACHIRKAEVFYTLDESLSNALAEIKMELSSIPHGSIRWCMYAPDGGTIFEKKVKTSKKVLTLKQSMNNIRLWWPNGQGNPDQYSSSVELSDAKGKLLDSKISKIGFRKIRLVMHPTQWQDPETDHIPRGPVKNPITVEINGRSMFCKGSNWVSPDIFPGRITVDLLRQSVLLAKEANFNMLRCWGGAIVQRDEFFDLCDEHGILVWQEFQMACNKYEGTPEYLKVLDRESRFIIENLRQHPSLIIWCGGNELFNHWSGMTEQDHALRLLNRNCFDLDPTRPFLYTSPLFGMGHGFYLFSFIDYTREVFECFQKANCTAYVEFGVPSPAYPDTLRKIIPEGELFPPKQGTTWSLRHGFNAWSASEESWLELTCIERYFGKINTLEELVEYGQLLQSEGLKSVFEEARRQKPVCSMVLNWCFNEPWPCAANNSLLSWPIRPKPAYSAVKSSLRGVLYSAKIPKFAWRSGETFRFELWLLNDSQSSIEGGKVTVGLDMDGTIAELGEYVFDAPDLSANKKGKEFSHILPSKKPCIMKLMLSDELHPERDTDYLLVYEKHVFNYLENT